MPPLPCLFIGHGGGPMPLLGDPGHKELMETWRPGSRVHSVVRDPRVKHILVVSAHHMGSNNTCLVQTCAPAPGAPEAARRSRESPGLLYDYYGFPDEAYRLRFPNVCAPDLSARVVEALTAGGVSCALERGRGFDHGVFVPLLALEVGPDLPVVQVSLANESDVELHVEIGRLLGPLRHEGVLIVGSGMSFHNMRAFMSPPGTVKVPGGLSVADASAKFNEHLRQMVTQGKSAKSWERSDVARFCHPPGAAEHLFPLFVVMGASGAAAADDSTQTREFESDVEVITWRMMGMVACSHFIFHGHQ